MSDKFHGGIKAGSVDVSLPVVLRKTADNTETTAVAHSSVTASYWRQGGTRTAITMAALTNINDAHSDGGWKETDSTNMPGAYRFDVPDAAFATGADWVIVTVKVASSYVFVERYNLESKGAKENNDLLANATFGLSALETLVDGLESSLADGTNGLTAIKNAINTIDDFVDTEMAAVLAAVDTEIATIVADVTTLLTRLSSARAGYLDNLSAGAVALEATADAIEADTQDIQSRLPAALTAGGNMKSDALAIDGSTVAANKLKRSAKNIVYGTASGVPTTTSIPTSSLTPAVSVADQLNGRVIIFDDDTTTAALRGQASDITDVTSGGVLTVTALTTAPVSGDTFVIV
jgi:hypothetical protein